MNKSYTLADDCPNCGEKDETDMWKGARKGSTSWGHLFFCCSDKCGREFLNSPEHKKRMREQIEAQIEAQKTELEKWQ